MFTMGGGLFGGGWLVPTNRCTGRLNPIAPSSSVAFAVRSYAPGGTLLHVRKKRLLLTLPDVPALPKPRLWSFEKNSTDVRKPSESCANARMKMFAGARNAALFDGWTMLTNGGWLVGDGGWLVPTNMCTGRLIP